MVSNLVLVSVVTCFVRETLFALLFPLPWYKLLNLAISDALWKLDPLNDIILIEYVTIPGAKLWTLSRPLAR